MSSKVWVTVERHSNPKIFRFPVQVRQYAKEIGYSTSDEMEKMDDTIIFSRKDFVGDEIGFYAILTEVK